MIVTTSSKDLIKHLISINDMGLYLSEKTLERARDSMHQEYLKRHITAIRDFNKDLYWHMNAQSEEKEDQFYPSADQFGDMDANYLKILYKNVSMRSLKVYFKNQITSYNNIIVNYANQLDRSLVEVLNKQKYKINDFINCC